MSHFKISAYSASLALTLFCANAFAVEKFAQDADIDAVEITRGSEDLKAVLAPRPDLDSVDTVMVFTNPRGSDTWVVCAGHNANGQGVGRARTRVPAHGVRLIFASDLSNGRDYIGSAICKARSRVVPSAFIIGADLSDAPARVSNGWSESQINFPVVATY